MRNNIRLNYKEGLGDQKCIFGLQTRSLREGGGKMKEKKRRRRGRRGAKPRYGCLPLVWSL